MFPSYPAVNNLGQTDDDAAYDGSAHRVESAQDDGGEGQQRGAAEGWIDGEGIDGEEDAANGGNGGSHTPCQGVDQANVDAHSQGCLLVKRGGSHREAIFRIAEEDEERDAHHNRDDDRPDVVRAEMDAPAIDATCDVEGRSGRDKDLIPNALRRRCAG